MNPTNLYLDVEFNGHGGELISLALASPTGRHWYGVANLPMLCLPWVQEHVLPVLHNTGVGAHALTIAHGKTFFRASLHEYLLPRSGSIIYADWPGDFAHLMRIMEGPSFEQSWIVDIGMQLLAESDPRPEVPHNALSDAIALMHWHATQGGTS